MHYLLQNTSVLSGNKKATGQNAQPKQVGRQPSKESMTEDKLAFVYPYGSTLGIQKPARSILSSGPISYPMNRPLAAIWESETVAEVGAQRGRLVVIGSVEIFGDDWIDKEENSKLCDTLFGWLLSEVDLDMTSDRLDADLTEFTPVPHIEALSLNLKPCLQGMDELPKDFTKLFDTSLFSFDTTLIPQAVQLYKVLGVPHEALTLIPPQFECPLPKVSAATFPPIIKELAPPALDQFDLDEHFAKESVRLSQLTNKCSNGDEDLEYYIAESGEILGVTKDLPFGERSAKHILLRIFKQIVSYKKQDGGKSDEESKPVVAEAIDEVLNDAEFRSVVEAVPVKSVHVAHVDLAPMKGSGKLMVDLLFTNINFKKSLTSSYCQALDPKMQLGGPSISKGEAKYDAK